MQVKLSGFGLWEFKYGRKTREVTENTNYEGKELEFHKHCHYYARAFYFWHANDNLMSSKDILVAVGFYAAQQLFPHWIA